MREEANLSQEALAEKAAIGRATLIRIENGEHSPRYETIMKLARALQVPPTRLFITYSEIGQ
jgi:transcriptional regulator with XRE-family HTH domain